MEKQILALNKNKNLVNYEQVCLNLKKNDAGDFAISAYTDKPLDDKTYSSGEIQLRERFRNMTDMFSVILLSRLKENEFTNERFKDAVKFVLDNYEYPEITIAAIIKFDKILDLKTNLQLQQMIPTFGSSIWNYYDAVDVNGACMYVEKGKMKQHNITLPAWKPKKYTPNPQKYIREGEEVEIDFTEIAKKFVVPEPVKKQRKVREEYMRPMTAEEIIAAAERERGKNV